MNQIDLQPSTRRPLGEATRRVNNINSQLQHTKNSYCPQLTPKYEITKDNCSHKKRNQSLKQSNYLHQNLLGESIENPRVSALVHEHEIGAGNRASSRLAAATSSGGKLKSCIGPWKLGKTLGRGSSARVRLARHQITGQEAAVKIVLKSSAQMSQSGSLANFEMAESNLHNNNSELRHMPAGIEREVAIMKLIQHPNILRLYDIWENRKEIYLCLEYVDNGELFEQIAKKGGLEEEEAMGYFRQILSAVEYCHSFNICHRDLKPENILLTSAGQIKIADFGMAALHQTPGHQLSTSCGSPHYAAPELIKGSKYNGNVVDIWSMGVILFATLAGRLPFDAQGISKKWLTPLLEKIKKGQYEMASNFSPEAKSLIRRMLQVNPKDRITISQIWKHPLLKKYDYLDNLRQDSHLLSPSADVCRQSKILRGEISSEIFRHLRSMWHSLSENELMEALIGSEPNDQKLFYNLLIKFRDAQLENYMPDLGHSSSDYHHVRPVSLTKTFSTCHFPQARKKFHRRTGSKFTVISNTPENEREHLKFNNYLKNRNREHDSKLLCCEMLSGSRESYENSKAIKPKVSRVSSQTTPCIVQKPPFPPETLASRQSLARSTRSHNSARKIRVSCDKKRRGVCFNHLRKNSPSGRRSHSLNSLLIHKPDCKNHSEIVPRDGDFSHPITRNFGFSIDDLSNKPQQISPSSNSVAVNLDHINQKFNEDVRLQSNSLARDCDEAFNGCGGSILKDPKTHMKYRVNSTPLNKKTKISDLNNRPLPQPPAMQIESVKIELLEAREKAELRRKLGGYESPAYLDRLVTHIDQLIQPLSQNNLSGDRRVISAPSDMRKNDVSNQLPSICEGGTESFSRKKKKDSVATDPERRQIDVRDGSSESDSEYLSVNDNWVTGSNSSPIRMDSVKILRSSSLSSLINSPVPLKTEESSLPVEPTFYQDKRQNYSIKNTSQLDNSFEKKLKVEEGIISKPRDNRRVQKRKDEDDTCLKNNAVFVKKKTNWFKRVLIQEVEMKSYDKDSKVFNASETAEHLYERRYCIFPDSRKKTSFNLSKFFKWRSSKPNMIFCDEFEHDDSLYKCSKNQDSTTDIKFGSSEGLSINQENDKLRLVAPQRNWWAKLFKVKPIVRFICFSISRKRARLETLNLLREWKRFGIQDIEVDKRRSIITGQVGVENYLKIKNVSFAAEFMTVIEHGKRSTLSIARWTQEQGAASSFEKVVETIEKVFGERNLLVTDQKKRKMMIKTIKLLSVRKT
ncbi:putative serine threonine-protein kinase gin4 [Golovinomyces cichoracearum]|uniref:non-specific serine/threonine protein kinase n=1 Tax=Golovinomyces cichoracearum TaxID=62708 RepID=A0A420IDJ2_9PEZI|nr:putative serine threonine-protein kinase gin4 [Golovinomyces cichoracearum]